MSACQHPLSPPFPTHLKTSLSLTRAPFVSTGFALVVCFFLLFQKTDTSHSRHTYTLTHTCHCHDITSYIQYYTTLLQVSAIGPRAERTAAYRVVIGGLPLVSRTILTHLCSWLKATEMPTRIPTALFVDALLRPGTERTPAGTPIP
jgi:hypothetical protein